MCSQACLQEMEKFWKDSIRSLLITALSSHNHGPKCPSFEVSDDSRQTTPSSRIASPSSSTPSSSCTNNQPLTPSGSKYESSTCDPLSPLSISSPAIMNNSNSLTPMVEMTASLLSDIISNLSVLKSNQLNQQTQQKPTNPTGKVKRKRRRKRYTLAQRQRFLQQSVWNSTENNDGQLRVESVLSFQETHKMAMLNQEENVKLRNNLISSPFGSAHVGGEAKDLNSLSQSFVAKLMDSSCKNQSPSNIHLASKMQSTELDSNVNNHSDDSNNGKLEKPSAKLEDHQIEHKGSTKRRFCLDAHSSHDNHGPANDEGGDDDRESNRENKKGKRMELHKDNKLYDNHDKSCLPETSKHESHVKHSNILSSFSPSKSLSSSSLSLTNDYSSEGSDKEVVKVNDDLGKFDHKVKQSKNHGLSRWGDSSSKGSTRLPSCSKGSSNKDKFNPVPPFNGNSKKININLHSVDSKRISSTENDRLLKDTSEDLGKDDRSESCDKSEKNHRSHSKICNSAISPSRSNKSRRDEVRDFDRNRKHTTKSRKQESSHSRSKSSSRSRSRSRSVNRHRGRSQEEKKDERKYRNTPSSSGYEHRSNKSRDKMSSRSRSKSESKRSNSHNRKERSSNGRSHHRSRRHSKSHRHHGHSSRSSSAYSTSSTSSSASSISKSSSSSDSSRFSSLISRSSRDSKSRSKSRSPSIRRRGGSPNFLERRRITSSRTFLFYYFF